jgi:hypothetical protein
LSAFLTARERVRDGLRRDPAFRESRAACFFVLADPRFGGGSFTPARRALDNPMAIACLAERGHVLPREYAPSLPVQIRLLALTVTFLRARLLEPVQLFLVLA